MKDPLQQSYQNIAFGSKAFILIIKIGIHPKYYKRELLNNDEKD